MNTYATTRMAEISLFSSGLLVGLFHLFLRANALRTVISPGSNSRSWNSRSSPKKKRPRLRFFGPSDLELQISAPLGPEHDVSRADSRAGLIDIRQSEEKSRFESDFSFYHEKPLSPASARSLGPVDLTKWPLPPEPLPPAYEQKQSPDTTRRHTRTKSYTLFPTRADDIPRLPATIYMPPESRLSRLALRRQKAGSASSSARESIRDGLTFLSKPAPLFASRHGRSNSSESSATVQIGLRFSVAPATLAAARCTAANRAMLSPNGGRTVGAATPILRRDGSDESGVSLGLPIQIPTPGTESGSTSNSSSSANIAAVQFPQPPNVHVRATPPVPRMVPRAAFVPWGADATGGKGKNLPPTPRSGRDWEAGGTSPPAIVVLPKPPMTTPPRVQGRMERERMPMTPLGMNPVSPASLQESSGGMGKSPPREGWI